MFAAVDWGSFWTTAIGAAIGASAAIVGGLIAGWYQLRGGREARQSAREDEARSLRNADLRALGDLTSKIFNGSGQIHLARKSQESYISVWYEQMARMTQSIQLTSILGDDKLEAAVARFIQIATIFGAEKAGDDERSAAFNNLSAQAAAVSTRIGVLIQS